MSFQPLGNSPVEASDWRGQVEVAPAPGTSAKAPGRWAFFSVSWRCPRCPQTRGIHLSILVIFMNHSE